MRGRTHTAAEAVRPLLEALAPGLDVRLELWDGSALGDVSGPTIHLRSADALRRLLWSPGELGLGRAYVAGDIDVGLDEDIVAAVAALRPAGAQLRMGPRQVTAAFRAAVRAGAIGRPLRSPPEEARPRGARHTRSRDAEVVSHHYDVGNDFYRIVLGPTLTYSCARFVDDTTGLDEAQTSKHDLVCRKLGLHERPGMRLLDVGCGWGSMAIHAAQRYGARVLAVTISQEQRDLAERRAAEAGVGEMVEIRLMDYRDVTGEPFDAVSSIGMSEHVGSAQIDDYFATLRSVLRPAGRLLNHAISSVGGSKLGGRTFMGRYVFPDGELLDVATTSAAMQRAGLEVRDVESLREHYARTLRHWVANLERGWDEAVRLVGERRARVWRLYMAASTVGFEDAGISVHQVLGVADDTVGRSGMPSTRDAWTTAAPSSTPSLKPPQQPADATRS